MKNIKTFLTTYWYLGVPLAVLLVITLFTSITASHKTEVDMVLLLVTAIAYYHKYLTDLIHAKVIAYETDIRNEVVKLISEFKSDVITSGENTLLEVKGAVGKTILSVKDTASNVESEIETDVSDAFKHSVTTVTTTVKTDVASAEAKVEDGISNVENTVKSDENVVKTDEVTVKSDVVSAESTAIALLPTIFRNRK